MVLGSIDLNDPSATATVIVALIPFALGCVTTYFQLFVDPPKEFRERIKLKRKELLERVAMMHATLLNHSRRIDSDEALRGDGREEPDLVGDYDRELFRLFSIFHRVEFIRLIVRVSYWIIYAAVAIALAAAIVASMFDAPRKYILWIAIVLILIELIIVAVVYFANEQLEGYEETT